MSDISLKIQETFVAQESIMKRILFFLLTFLLVLSEAQAQVLKFNLTVTAENGRPLRDVVVHCFFKKSDAEGAFKQASSTSSTSEFSFGQFDVDKYPPVPQSQPELKTRNDGKCLVSATLDSYILLDGNNLDGYSVELYHISDYVKDLSNTNITLVLPFKKETDSKGKKDFYENPELMDQVETTGVVNMGEAGSGIKREGMYITLTAEIDIDEEYARDNARFVAFPTVVYTEYEDSLCHLPPTVVDGVGYARDMIRRTGFDPSADLLHEFQYDGGTHLQDHQGERITYVSKMKVKRGTEYKVPALVWYEDFNGVYHKDSILIGDGEMEPLRFLNWDEARSVVELDTTVSVFKGSAEVVSDPEKNDYKLNFEQGQEQLNFKDSVTQAQYEELTKWLDECYQIKNGMIERIAVRAFASPEGKESINRSLSRRRTQNIVQLLKNRYKNVKIESVFDVYDNIVPWKIVADSMSMSQDTLAWQYADEIRGIVSSTLELDEQEKALKSNVPAAYEYASKFLDKVRMTSIEATIIVQKVLSREEVIDLYNKDRSSVKEICRYIYQSYYLLCYLADEERWDELYDFSKMAYEHHNKSHFAERRFNKPTQKNPKATVTEESMLPYPMAAYYYALSCMRKGEVNTSILQDYLDDLPVSKPGNLRYDVYAINQLPFVATQVLMYCQEENFEMADTLIQKYRLLDFSELYGMVMFVRCLGGAYKTSEEVRNYVMSTSDLNRAVILTATEKYKEALNVLFSGDVPKDDAKVEYMKAICRFRLLDGNLTKYHAESLPISALYDYEAEFEDDDNDKKEEGPESQPWAIPMLNSIRLDESNLEYLQKDGYFNRAYRQMISFAWSRMKDGISLERISQEYSALVNKMLKEKENSKN